MKPSSEPELSRLLNLGRVSAGWLRDAGIRTEAQLRVLGAVNAFRLVAMAGHRPSLNLVYAIEAGLQGRLWTELSPGERDRLRREVESPWNPNDLPDF